uniref:RPGR1_C domain-containing protein n=1 Tax=Macrostomum lignano TaxID=282301 RepID=A0A1I8J8Y7_9PLAT
MESSCVVKIFSVRLDQTCPDLAGLNLRSSKFYVLFDLPSYKLEATRTPAILPTRKPGASTRQDLVLKFDYESSYDYSSRGKRQALDDMLSRYHADVNFTLMCLPDESQSEVNLGRAVVRLDNRIARKDDVQKESFPALSRRTQSTSKADSREMCTVCISSVQLEQSCRALQNPELDNTNSFVSFDLPGFDMDETETSLSLPTPRPGRTKAKDFHLRFNFQKRFDYSYDTNYNKRIQLATLLMASPVKLPFTLVCEAEDQDSEFFLDFGTAVVKLEDRVSDGKDIQDESFPLLNGDEVVGSITISTNLPSLLREICDEIPEGKKKSITFLKS